MTGTDRQSLARNRYAQIGESDFNTPWGDLSYAGGMYDLNLIIGKTSGDSPHYSGVAKIMMAAYLGNMTDCFGDIPYSQAFQGERITSSRSSIHKRTSTTASSPFWMKA